MAGRARLQALKDELDRRTIEYFDVDLTDPAITQSFPSHLDYVCARIESGATAKAIALELSNALNVEIQYDALMRYLRNQFGETAADESISQARARASHCLAEESIDIVDNAPEFAAGVSKAMSRARSRQWYAEKWNPQRYGQNKQQNVSISVTTLHLDALRAHSTQVTTGSTTPLVGSGEPVMVISASD